MDNELLEKIEENDFWDYANEYVVKRSHFFNTLKAETLMRYSLKLNHPLTKLSSAMEKNAFQTFKSIIFHPIRTNQTIFLKK